MLPFAHVRAIYGHAQPAVRPSLDATPDGDCGVEHCVEFERSSRSLHQGRRGHNKRWGRSAAAHLSGLLVVEAVLHPRLPLRLCRGSSGQGQPGKVVARAGRMRAVEQVAVRLDDGVARCTSAPKERFQCVPSVQRTGADAGPAGGRLREVIGEPDQFRRFAVPVLQPEPTHGQSASSSCRAPAAEGRR